MDSINNHEFDTFDVPGDDDWTEWHDGEEEEDETGLMEAANEAIDSIVRTYDFLIENEIDSKRIEILQNLRAGFLEDNK
jgi:hypothetical protein